jgi:hypothetical protein
MSATQRREEDADAFWRKLVLPQEERMRLGIPWRGGYRWFRSPNVVCLEHYRRRLATRVVGGGRHGRA